MEKETKEITLSMSPEMFAYLQTVQQQEYAQNSPNEMLVDLIRKGLSTIKGLNQENNPYTE